MFERIEDFFYEHPIFGYMLGGLVLGFLATVVIGIFVGICYLATKVNGWFFILLPMYFGVIIGFIVGVDEEL